MECTLWRYKSHCFSQWVLTHAHTFSALPTVTHHAGVVQVSAMLQSGVLVFHMNHAKEFETESTDLYHVAMDVS